MTIDEHIEQLKKLRSFHNGSYGTSVNFAIDTMRKYQKIEEIVDKWNEGIYDDEGLTHTEVMELVSDEVLKDGGGRWE